MADDRSRYGLLVSALGAIVLAVSVFLPWYGVSFTPTGLALAEQVGNQVASQFGNAALQSYMSGLHASLSTLAGHEFTAVSAHQVLSNMNVVLLVLAGLGALDGLVALARSGASVPDGRGAAIALLGGVAVACVLYRIVVPPTPAGGVLALSLREGAWLALLGSCAMVVGGLWPAHRRTQLPSEAKVQGAWSSLSGWTPET